MRDVMSQYRALARGFYNLEPPDDYFGNLVDDPKEAEEEVRLEDEYDE